VYMRIYRLSVIHPGSPGAPSFRVLSGGGNMLRQPDWSCGAERIILYFKAVQLTGIAQGKKAVF
jgi:hypothetical protein